MDLREFKQVYQPLSGKRMSDEFRTRVIESIEGASAISTTHERKGMVRLLSKRVIATVVAVVVIVFPTTGYAFYKFVAPIIFQGSPVVQRVQETPPTEADFQRAIRVVRDLIQATNAGDGPVVRTLLFNTAPAPIPKTLFQNSKERPTKPVAYVIGTPYVLENWSTRPYNAVTSPSSDVAHEYSRVFAYAITVPVYYGKGNTGHPILLHCVRDTSGHWRVAYNWFKGYDIQDNPNDSPSKIITLPLK